MQLFRCARQSDPPVRMGCLSAAAESGRALSAICFITLYCIVAYFLWFVNWFLKKSCEPYSMLIIVIIEQFIKQLVHARGIAKRRLEKRACILEHQSEIEPVAMCIELSG